MDRAKEKQAFDKLRTSGVAKIVLVGLFFVSLILGIGWLSEQKLENFLATVALVFGLFLYTLKKLTFPPLPIIEVDEKVSDDFPKSLQVKKEQKKLTISFSYRVQAFVSLSISLFLLFSSQRSDRSFNVVFIFLSVILGLFAFIKFFAKKRIQITDTALRVLTNGVFSEKIKFEIDRKDIKHVYYSAGGKLSSQIILVTKKNKAVLVAGTAFDSLATDEGRYITNAIERNFELEPITFSGYRNLIRFSRVFP